MRLITIEQSFDNDISSVSKLSVLIYFNKRGEILFLYLSKKKFFLLQ